MKDIVYKFLKRNYPIDGDVVDVTFNEDIANVVEEVLGVKEINFFDWAHDRIGDKFTYYTTTPSGLQVWYNENGEIHRDNDKPAVIEKDRFEAWYQNGKLHRDDDKPALIIGNNNGDIATLALGNFRIELPPMGKLWCINHKPYKKYIPHIGVIEIYQGKKGLLTRIKELFIL